MSGTKYQFYLAAEGVEKTTVVVVKRIRAYDDETWFSFPEDSQKIECHKAILELGPIKSAVKVLRSRGQYRTVNVTLSPELEENYVDSDGNFIFRDYLLAETRLIPPPMHTQVASGELGGISSCLSKLAEPREESVKAILQHFFVEKFSAKNRNVEAWCTAFEKESLRFKLSDQKQIEIFKSCLDTSMGDWFSVAQRKLGISAGWSEWKKDLVATFGDTSWKPVRYAFSYKYLSGSYIDYAVRKEKMLLDLDRSLSDLFILDLIVVGLPVHIQNSLNRNQVTDVKTLHNKLKKFEAEDKIFDNNVNSKSSKFSGTSATFYSSTNKVNDSDTNKNKVNFSSEKKSNFVEKKPCPICSAKGYPGRFHPESLCWFKDKSPKKESNNINLDSASPVDEIQKN